MNLFRQNNDSFLLVRPEPAPAPGRRDLVRPLTATWCVLAALALALGLTWRLTGLAPGLTLALDGCGLALWTVALTLTPAWNDLLKRRIRHGRHGLRWTGRHLGDVGLLWLATLILSLAPVGLLLTYNPRMPLPGIEAFPLNLPLPAWAWFLGVLLLAGPALVTASTVVLHLARRFLGPALGSAGWLLTGLLVHRNLIIGEVISFTRTEVGWLPVVNLTGFLDPDMLLLPVSLGDYARWWALKAAGTHNEAAFLGEFILNLIRNPALITVVALVLLVTLSRPLARSQGPLPMGWLAAWAAIAAIALRAAAQGWLWTGDTSRIFPGSWTGHFCLGIGTVWLVWLILELYRRGRTPWLKLADMAWAWIALAAVVLLALPYIEAGQTTHGELLLAAAAAWPVMTLGLIAINYVARLGSTPGSAGRYARLALLGALLVLPLPAGDGVLAPGLQGWLLLTEALTDPQTGVYALGITVLTTVCCVIIWPRRPVHSKASAGSPRQ